RHAEPLSTGRSQTPKSWFRVPAEPAEAPYLSCCELGNTPRRWYSTLRGDDEQLDPGARAVLWIGVIRPAGKCIARSGNTCPVGCVPRAEVPSNLGAAGPPAQRCPRMGAPAVRQTLTAPGSTSSVAATPASSMLGGPITGHRDKGDHNGTFERAEISQRPHST